MDLQQSPEKSLKIKRRNARGKIEKNVGKRIKRIPRQDKIFDKREGGDLGKNKNAECPESLSENYYIK